MGDRDRSEGLITAIREARAAIEHAGTGEDPMVVVVEILDNALAAHGAPAPATPEGPVPDEEWFTWALELADEFGLSRGPVANPIDAEGWSSAELRTRLDALIRANAPSSATPVGGPDALRGVCRDIDDLRILLNGESEPTPEELDEELRRLTLKTFARIDGLAAAPATREGRAERLPPGFRPRWAGEQHGYACRERLWVFSSEEAWDVYDSEHPSAAPAPVRDETVPPPGWRWCSGDHMVRQGVVQRRETPRTKLAEAWVIYDREHGYPPAAAAPAEPTGECRRAELVRFAEWASGDPVFNGNATTAELEQRIDAYLAGRS